MVREYSKVQVWLLREASGASGGDVEVLLLKTNVARQSFWQPVTGSVEEGESLEQAALREATEETGLCFASPPRATGFSFVFENRFGRAHEHAFVARVESETAKAAVRLDPHEHSEWRWVPAAEALGMLKFEENREALRRILNSGQGAE